MISAESLLLDTHVWVWLNLEPGRLKGRRVRRLVDRVSEMGRLYVSAISAWEVALLWKKGRLELDLPPGEWVDRALHAPGLRTLDVTSPIAVESVALPGVFHGDPADRMLVATARLRGLTLVTADRRLLDYAEAGHVRALAAG